TRRPTPTRAANSHSAIPSNGVKRGPVTSAVGVALKVYNWRRTVWHAMTTLEYLTPGAVVRGCVPGEPVTVVASRWAGSRSVVLTFRTDAGRVDEQVVYRTQEAELTLDDRGAAWSFDGDGAL